MYQEINEPIQVAGIFKDGALKPFKFLWHGKEFAVEKVNLSYSSFEGRAKLYFFAVSGGGNYFKLQFNADNLIWTLLESYVD